MRTTIFRGCARDLTVDHIARFVTGTCLSLSLASLMLCTNLPAFGQSEDSEKTVINYASPIPLEGVSAGPGGTESQGREVFSLSFSEDGSRLLVGIDDLAAHEFETATGRRTLTQLNPDGLNGEIGRPKELFFDPERNNFLEGHISEIASVVFVPSGKLLLTGDYFGEISVWDADDDGDGIGREVSRLLPGYSFSEFTVSDDGKKILAGGAVFDESAEAVAKTAGTEGRVLNHMGVLWYTEDIQGSTTVSPRMTLEGEHPGSAITAVALSPSGNRAVTAGRRGRIVVWDISGETPTPIARVTEDSLRTQERDQISGIFFETEDQLIAAGYDGEVKRWKISGENLQGEIIPRRDSNVRAEFILRLRPSPDRTRFMTSQVVLSTSPTEEKPEKLTITCWTAGNSTAGTESRQHELLEVPLDNLTTDDGKYKRQDKGNAFRHDISWSANGRQLMFVDGRKNVLSVYNVGNWEVDGGKWVTKVNSYRIDDGRPADEERTKQSIGVVRGAFSPEVNGTLRIATFDGRFSQLWKLPEGTHIGEFRSHAGYNIAVGFSLDRKYVVTGSETIRIFNADEEDPRNHGRCVYRLPLRSKFRSPVDDVAVGNTPDGMKIASVNLKGEVEVWNWNSATPAAVAPLSELTDTESLNAELRASVQEKSAEETQVAGNAVTWSSDGRFLGAVQSGQIRLWKVEGNQFSPISLKLPEEFQDIHFNDVDFSHTGYSLAAGGNALPVEGGDIVSLACVWKINDEGDAGSPMSVAGDAIDSSIQDTGNENERQQELGITAISYDDTRGEVLTGGSDNSLQRYRVPAVGNRLLRQEELTLDDNDSPHRSPVTSIDIAADGTAASADESGRVWIWHPSEASP